MTRLATHLDVTQVTEPRGSLAARMADYLELTKPRIVILELVTVVVAAHLASPHGLDSWLLVHLVCGAALIAASAGAMNQWLEIGTDARMHRTAARPLPAGRLRSGEVVLFALLALVLGTSQLAIFANPVSAALGLATWLVYVLAYTPLKSRSPLNTAVGAVSGALPILMGWTATGTPLDARVWSLAAVLFLWQFPHFMSIAWLHRDDYARAGQRMLTVVDPTGLRAGAQAVIGALLIVPLSLVPALVPQTASPTLYAFWALVLAVVQLAAATAFFARRSETSARRLLRASLVYLCCWMALLVMVTV
jgi:protoheme IX farnesyltransferase